MYSLKKGYAVLQTGLIIWSLLFVAACDNKNAKDSVKTNVSVTRMTQTRIPLVKQYIGITQSIASIQIRARVEGFLTEMNFIEGRPVKKNDLLFVIDPKPYQAALDSAKGQLARAEADLEYQQVQYQRFKELVAQGNVSKSQYDTVLAAYHQAIAQVDIGKAQVETAKINLGYCYMYSPVDGIVGKRYVDVGNLVGASEETLLAYVVKLDPLFIEFSPSVEDFGEFLKFHKNMPLPAEAVFPNGEGLTLKGSVNLVNNQADTSTSTVYMRATLENPEGLVLPGIYMNLNVTLTPDAEVLLVPATAVIETQGQRAVYLVNKNNQVESRSIFINGHYQNSYIVKSGLTEGDLVILSGLQKLKPGQQVNAVIANGKAT